MARLLSMERDNAEIKKDNAEIKKESTEQKKKIAELETELSTLRQSSIGVCLPSSLFCFFPTHPSYFRPFIGSNCDQQNPPTHPARLGPRQTSNPVWVQGLERLESPRRSTDNGRLCEGIRFNQS